ncbi:MAG: J domain-containing protein [Gammaproteobacteria bacterium]|nr:MAG: J domain-containing protein [Gammaproteobacteria bacterium]
MEFKDYYAIMGVSRDAAQDEIKRSYRKLARKFHPDVSSDSQAEERFKEVGEAYEVLKDPEKRAAYDQLGAQWQQGQDFEPPPDWDQGFEFRDGGYTESDAAHFSDFFDSLFGGRGHGGGRSHQRFRGRGEDHHAKVSVDLEDSYTGARRAITLRSPELTDDGHVVVRERTLNVRIPKGIRSGQRIRLAGQGGPGLGDGQAGDLYLQVELNAHGLYRVDGRDVYLDLPVAPWEAALGATVKSPTPSGAVDLRIPPNSNHGSKLRLKGKGIPGKERGDMYVVLKITLPPSNDDSRAIYKEMEEKMAFDPRANMGA